MMYLALFCFVFLLYSYVGFPIFVFLLARLRPRKWASDDTIRPRISIILPVYNEELILHRSLTALAEQEYPSEHFEILVGSDGSSDLSPQTILKIAEQFPNVRPFLFATRRGKMSVLNDLVKEATGDILFFSDADVSQSDQPNQSPSNIDTSIMRLP